MRLRAGLLATLGLLLLAGPVSHADAQARPANDDRQDAMVIAGGSTWTVSGGATAELGELAHHGRPADHSIWYRWVAPSSGTARITVCSRDVDVVAAVYTPMGGPALASAARAPDSHPAAAECRTFNRQGPTTVVELPVVADRSYLIAVDGDMVASSVVELVRPRVVTPGADDADDAMSLVPGASGYGNDVALGENELAAGATAEPAEPSHGGRPARRSVWWRWTATSTGRVTLKTCFPGADDGDRDTSLAVYEGRTIEAASRVAESSEGCANGNAALSFVARRGTLYRVAVDQHGTPGGAVLLLGAPPGNDRFVDAAPLEQTATVDLSAAGREPDEPDHGGIPAERSLWFTWIAAHDGPASIGRCDGRFDGRVAVYRGERVDDLEEVAPAADSDDGLDCDHRTHAVRFDARAGEAYRVAVDGARGEDGRATVRAQQAPAADRFADTPVVRGIVGINDWSTHHSLSLGTAEPGEPSVDGTAPERSSWVRFDVDEPTGMRLQVCAREPVERLRTAIYSGETLADLVPVRATVEPASCDGGRGLRLRFRAVPGTHYAMSIDASVATGVAVFALAFAANDAVADAIALRADVPTRDDSLVDATSEPGEPDHGGGPATVWFREESATPRSVVLSVCRSAGDVDTTQVIAAYVRDAAGALVPAPGARRERCKTGRPYGRVVLDVTPGQPVLVVVAADEGDTQLHLLRRSIPSNDDFADARRLDSAAEDIAELEIAGATREAGEPAHAGGTGEHSQWWSYASRRERLVDAEVCGERSNGARPRLVVYRGDRLDALTEIARSRVIDTDRWCEALSFAAAAGVEYRVAVDTDGPWAAGVRRLSWTTSGPPNDDRVDATRVHATSGYGRADLTDATREPGERRHAGAAGPSVWYRFTPLRDGPLDISVCSADPTGFAVYAGSNDVPLAESVPPTDETECATTWTTFEAAAGTEYALAVAASGCCAGTASVRTRQPPGNDDVAGAGTLVPDEPTLVDLRQATAERGEPLHHGARPVRTAWLAWSATSSGRAVVEACQGAARSRRIAVYTGDSVESLVPVASADAANRCVKGSGPVVDFAAVAGVRYLVAVDSADEPNDPFAVTLHLAPDGDHQDAPAELPQPGASVALDLTAASREVDERRHAGTVGSGSAWFRYEADADLDLEVSSCGAEDVDTLAAVYREASDGGLTPVAHDDDSAGCGPGGRGSRVRWTAVTGQRYLVALDVAGARRGRVRVATRSVSPETRRTWIVGDVPRRTFDDGVRVAFASDAPTDAHECRVDRDRSWSSCTSPVVLDDLSEGEHTLAIRPTTGGDPAVAAFAVDRSAPAPRITAPRDGDTPGAGQVDIVGVCGRAAGDRTSVRVRVWAGTTPSGPPVYDDEDDYCAREFWVNVDGMPPGWHTAQVTQADDVGNLGTSPPVAFAVGGPSIEITSPTPSGAVNALAVEGRSSGTERLVARIWAAGAPAQDGRLLPADLDADGHFALRVEDLVDGEYRYRLEQDYRGAPVIGAERPVVIDRSAPRPVIARPVDGAVLETHPTDIAGTAEPGMVTVTVTDERTQAVLAEEEAPVDHEVWRVEMPPSANRGRFRVTARQTDQAGNVGVVEVGYEVREVEAPRPAPDPVASTSVPDTPPATPSTAPSAVGESPPVSAAPVTAARPPAPFTMSRARALADARLTGRGVTSRRAALGPGVRLFVVRHARIVIPASRTVVAAAAIVCSDACVVQMRGNVTTSGRSGAASRPVSGVTRRGVVVPRVRLRPAEIRRIRRARGGTLRLAITVTGRDSVAHTTRTSVRIRTR